MIRRLLLSTTRTIGMIKPRYLSCVQKFGQTDLLSAYLRDQTAPRFRKFGVSDGIY